MKKLSKNLAMCICMFMAVFCAMTLRVEAANVTSGYLGDNGGFTWTYDADTKTLTITGEDSGLEGTYDEAASKYISPFASICSDVEVIIVQDCTLKGSVRGVFACLDDLKRVEFDDFDTADVTDMSYMFCKCGQLEELDLSEFDTAKVTDMTSMFEQCFKLSELDFSAFTTNNLTSMRKMFYKCRSLSELDLIYFDTLNVTDLYYTFAECTSLTTLFIDSFDLGKVTNVKNTFSNCSSLVTICTPYYMPETLSIDLPATYGEVNNRNNSTTKLTSAFCENVLVRVILVSEINLSASSLTLKMGESSQLSATVLPENATTKELKWESSDTAVVTVDAIIGKVTAVGEGTATITATAKDGSGKSASCEVTVDRPTSGYLGDNDGIYWTYDTDTKTLTIKGKDSGIEGIYDASTNKYTSLFEKYCDDVEIIELKNCTLIGRTIGLFANLKSLKEVRCYNVDTSDVVSMDSMFIGCSNLSSIEVSDWDTSNVIAMNSMFADCTSLVSLDLSNWDTSSVAYTASMFYDCTGLIDLNVSNFDTSNVRVLWGMFYGCASLTSLDLSSFDLSQIMDAGYALYGCSNLAIINTPKAMPDNKALDLPGTYMNSDKKRTTVLDQNFCNTTLVNENNLVTSVSVSPTSAELKPGDTKQLQATVTPTKAAMKDVTWKSSNTAVATVDATGKVTAVGEGSATITATATDLLGTSVSASCSVTVAIPMSEQERQVRAFVERMYTVALGRAAETEGLNFYVQRLLSGDSNGACIAESFLCSPEFLNKGHSDAEYVKVLYRTFFDREPAAEEVNYWVDKLSNGQTKAFVLSGFVNSYEFDNLCASYGISRGFMREDGKPLNPGIGRFAERMYTVVLERAGEKEGIEYWSLSIANGVCTPKDAAKNFFLSQEYINKNTSDAKYITTLYKAFMDREPEEGGVEYWQNVLKNGATREQILEGFADSAEFKGIMASFGL